MKSFKWCWQIKMLLKCLLPTHHVGCWQIFTDWHVKNPFEGISFHFYHSVGSLNPTFLCFCCIVCVLMQRWQLRVPLSVRPSPSRVFGAGLPRAECWGRQHTQMFTAVSYHCEPVKAEAPLSNMCLWCAGSQPMVQWRATCCDSSHSVVYSVTLQM